MALDWNETMNDFTKAIHTLEFDHILSQVGDCCELESGKEKILSLTPSSDRDWVGRALKQTTDAKEL